MTGAVPRILALVAAVAMVLVALAVRDRMDEDEATGGQPLRLVCATELEDVCRELAEAEAEVDVVVEDAGVTLDRLRDGPGTGVDGWLTPGPFPQMVQELRRLAGRPAVFTEVSDPLARTRLGLAAWSERSRRLTCPGEVGWRCIGDAAGRPWSEVGGEPVWGPVKTALPDPGRTATGLLSLGAATAGFFGRTDIASVDLDDDDQFGVWFDRLRRANQSTDLGRMLAIGPAAVDFVAGLEQATVPSLAASARKDQVAVIYPSPVANADVVLGTAGTGRGKRLVELVTRASLGEDLVRAGWKAPSSAASGLPSAGLLSVLRDRWTQ